MYIKALLIQSREQKNKYITQLSTSIMSGNNWNWTSLCTHHLNPQWTSEYWGSSWQKLHRKCSCCESCDEFLFLFLLIHATATAKYLIVLVLIIHHRQLHFKSSEIAACLSQEQEGWMERKGTTCSCSTKRAAVVAVPSTTSQATTSTLGSKKMRRENGEKPSRLQGSRSEIRSWSGGSGIRS